MFVYKLIVAGSVEERMLALQQRKRELAEGVLGPSGEQRTAFGEDDLKALFEPLR